jgi:outer membrane lipase/esterase
MIRRGLGILGLGLLLAGPASAQTFSNIFFFGDSRTDSGIYLYKPYTFGGQAPAGTGTFTTNPGLGWAAAFGQNFGISVAPSDTPGTGGNNYAAGGSRLVSDFGNTPSSATQIGSYLAGAGGAADPNALYVFWNGANDIGSSTVAIPGIPGSLGNVVNPQNLAGLNTLAGQAIGQVSSLVNAGARYILVPNASTLSGAAAVASGFPWSPTATASKALFDQMVWNGLAAKGINFIPADSIGLRSYVILNPAPFGITNVNYATPACIGVRSFACGPANYATPDADKTYFWAEGTGEHVTTAVQKITADYFYSLVVAPSQISYLAEAPVRTRLGIVNAIQSQIPLSFSTPGAFHGWASGDISWLKMTNSSAGFPDDPGTPLATSAGFDYALTRDWLVGLAFSAGHTRQTFSLGGDFKQTEFAVSAYTALRKDAYWLNAIGTWGSIDDTINRQIPLGITTQSNRGSTNGTNISFAIEGGYNFKTALGPASGASRLPLKAPQPEAAYLTHGPVAGVILQQVYVGSFAETNLSGAPTNLAFSSQVRNSAVTELGYQASVTFDRWEPYAKAVWNHELAGSGRLVTASLLSITAPSYSLPAVALGKDWGSATIGTRVRFAPDVTAYAAFNSYFGQSNVIAYGGQIGLNVAFQPPANIARH